MSSFKFDEFMQLLMSFFFFNLTKNFGKSRLFLFFIGIGGQKSCEIWVLRTSFPFKTASRFNTSEFYSILLLFSLARDYLFKCYLVN